MSPQYMFSWRYTKNIGTFRLKKVPYQALRALDKVLVQRVFYPLLYSLMLKCPFAMLNSLSTKLN